MVWSKWLQPPVYSNHALPTPDGGYLSVGYGYNALTQSSDNLVIKFDSEGNVEWSGLYGGTAFDEGIQIQATVEGDYVMCGETYSYGSNTVRSIGIVKIDGNGSMLWQRVVGTASDDLPCQGMSVARNGAIYAGSSITNSGLAGNKNAFIVKLLGAGVTEWAKVVGGAWTTNLRNVEATEDNGVLLTGVRMDLGRETLTDSL